MNTGTTSKLYLYSILIKISTVFLGFFNSILISRLLGVELRGDYSVLVSTGSIIQIVFSFGLGFSYPIFRKKYGDDIKSIFIFLLTILSLFYLIICLILYILFPSQYLSIIYVYLLTMNFQLTSISLIENIKKKNVLVFLANVIISFVIFLLFINKCNNYSLIILFSLICKAFLENLFLICGFNYGLKKSKQYIYLIKEIFTSGISIMIISLLVTVNYNIDLLMLKGYSINRNDIGLYGVAISLMNMLWILPDAFKEMIYNRLASGGKIKEVIYSLLINVLYMLIMLFIFLTIGDLVIRLLYGIEFAQSINYVIVILIGAFPKLLYKIIHPIYIINSKVNVVVMFLSLSVIINIISNLVIIPYLGAYGAALSTVISYSLCGFAFLIKFYFDYIKHKPIA